MQPVTLDPAQIDELTRHFSGFRHDVNGCLSLIVAATELIRYSPDVVKRMSATLIEQPPRIAGKTAEFIQECERVLGIRPESEPSWYRDLSKRHNAAAGDPTEAISVPPETAKELHTNLLQLSKELSQTSFIVSGANVLAHLDVPTAVDVTRTSAEQLPKLSKKFEQFAAALEKALNVTASAPRKLVSGAPSGAITLSVDKVALFHRRLGNLQRDITEQLGPLLELSRLARSNPEQVQTRAAEFAKQPPLISSLVGEFAAEFDSTFGIVRG